MSNVLDRPRVSTRPSPQAEPAVAVWVRGALAAVWAVGVGLGPLIALSLIVWAADSSSSAGAGSAMRFGVQLWLLAHRVPLRLPAGGALTIPPLLLTIGIGLLVARGAAIVARTTKCADGRDVATVAAAVTAPYAIMTTVLAVVAPSSAFKPSIGAAFICAIVVAGVASAIGAIRGSGLARTIWDSLPPAGRVPIQGAGSAGVVLFGAATLLVAGSLVSHSGQFGDLVRPYHGGSGKFSMVLLSLFMLPNAIVFAVGYIVGPGFAIGTGTSVGYGGAHLGAMPAFPLLAAVPTGSAPWQITVVFSAALVAAGIVAGWRVSTAAGLTMEERLRGALVAGSIFGVMCAVAVAFSGGPAGPGRLRAVGPSPWQVGLLVALEISVVATATVVVRQVAGKLRRAVPK